MILLIHRTSTYTLGFRITGCFSNIVRTFESLSRWHELLDYSNLVTTMVRAHVVFGFCGEVGTSAKQGPTNRSRSSGSHFAT